MKSTPISNIIFVGHNGRVHGIDKHNGNVIWTNELSGFSYDVVSIVPDTADSVARYISFAEPRGPSNTPTGSPPRPMLFVGSHGKLCALDMLSGREIWRTDVGGFKSECFSMVVPVVSQDSVATLSRCMEPLPPFSEPGSPYHIGNPHHILFVATHGKVRAFSKPANNSIGYISKELWQYNFPGGGYDTPTLLFDSSPQSTAVIFVAGNGRVACLNVTNGSEVWKIKLPGMVGTWVSLADAKGGAWGNNAYVGSSSQPTLLAHRFEQRQGH
ncbi:hypothetical protein HK102_005638 [Quaeritorhiza haematococci]|nr:hypothetical protein HK102_005638 [Quaeritorhiza haematococci]